MEILIVFNIVLILAIAFLIYKVNNYKYPDPDVEKLESISNLLGQIPDIFRNESKENREELSNRLKENREENSKSIKDLIDSVNSQLNSFNDSFAQNIGIFSTKLDSLMDKNEKKLDIVNQTIESKLKSIQADNSTQLEEMRKTVDEKLHSTLEKRLGDSFKQVVDQLENVHRGLGEMQNLAVGVGDLKKVLTKIRTRGMFGEYQLKDLLVETLAPSQYEENVKTKSGSNDEVEFAIKFPGKDNLDHPVWMPIDCKFPLEKQQALMDAYEIGDILSIEKAKKELKMSIKDCAKLISQKYIDPPNTTDFAIMFLPFESLYAEVLSIPGLFEEIHNTYKVTITGPTTISALLNSFRMGFRTLAIEKRSSEVWNLLGAIKTQFDSFGSILAKTKKKIEQAGKEIEGAESRTRVIRNKLKDVEELPQTQSISLLGENFTNTDEINSENLSFVDPEEVTLLDEENTIEDEVEDDELPF